MLPGEWRASRRRPRTTLIGRVEVLHGFIEKVEVKGMLEWSIPSFCRRSYLPPHAFQIDVEERGGLDAGGIALAEQLDLETAAFVGDLLRHIAHRDGGS